MKSSLRLGLLLISCFATSTHCNRPLIRVAGYGIKPYIDLKACEGGLPKGIDPDFIRLLSKMLKFDYTFIEANAWGHVVDNKWVGIIGEVKKLTKIVEGKADVGIGLISYNHQRYQSVDYTTAIYQSFPIYLSSKPNPLPQHFNVIKPFSFITWALICVTLVFAAIVISKVTLTKTSSSWMQGLTQTWLSTLGLLLQQSYLRMRPIAMSNIIMSVGWLFFCTIICMAFECNLRANLIIVDYEEVVDTAEDMVRLQRPFYPLGGSGILFVYQTSPSKFDRQIIKDAVDNDRYVEWEDGFYSAAFLKKLELSRGAMFLDVASYPALAKLSLRKFGYNPFRKGKHIIIMDYKGFVLPKKSPWMEKFNVAILQISAAGIVEKLFSKNSPIYIESQKENSTDVPLNLDHVLAAAIPLFTGWIFSVICFYAEIRVTAKSHKKVA